MTRKRSLYENKAWYFNKDQIGQFEVRISINNATGAKNYRYKNFKIYNLITENRYHVSTWVIKL